MNYVVLTLMIIILLYILFKKRSFDYFTVLVASTIVYYFPLVIGKIRPFEKSEVTIDIFTSVYSCVIAFILVLLFFIFINDKYKFKIYEMRIFNECEQNNTVFEDDLSNLSVCILDIIGIALLLYVYILYGGFSTNFSKVALLSESNRLTEYFKYIALFSFVYAFINKGKFITFIRIVSVILIGYTFLLGHRSFVFLGLIGIFLFRLGNGKKVQLSYFLRKHKIIVISFLLCCFFFMFVKGVFTAFMTGQFELVKSRLTDPTYYQNAFLTSESNSIVCNLQRVCANNMRYSFSDFIFGFIQLIPILGNFIAVTMSYKSFEMQLNMQFNSQLQEGIGLASTFLGETYSMGGVISEVLISFIVFLLILWFERKLYSTNSCLIATFLSVILPYFTFYIHRNSLIFLLIMARAYLYILLLTILLRALIKSLIYRTI